MVAAVPRPDAPFPSWRCPVATRGLADGGGDGRRKSVPRRVASVRLGEFGAAGTGGGQRTGGCDGPPERRVPVRSRSCLAGHAFWQSARTHGHFQKKCEREEKSFQGQPQGSSYFLRKCRVVRASPPETHAGQGKAVNGIPCAGRARRVRRAHRATHKVSCRIRHSDSIRPCHRCNARTPVVPDPDRAASNRECDRNRAPFDAYWRWGKAAPSRVEHQLLPVSCKACYLIARPPQ